MKRTKRLLKPRVLLTLALCAIAAPAAAGPSTARTASRTNTTTTLSTTASTIAGHGVIQTSGGDDDEVCTCIAEYSDGTSEQVADCSRSECPDLDTYNACRNAESTGVMPIGGCQLLEACECDCRSTELTTSEYFDEDIYLAGLPNLWQFDYACGAFGQNAVGCGPVAASMVMYWWAQQGYEGLVTGLMTGAGVSPAVREHDWQGMVETFRDDYLDGGICVADQYATLQGTMRDGLEDFINDGGYTASVDHYKVCDGCNRNASDEITADSGLDIILDELASGRPVIMGFNVGRAMDDTTFYDDYETDSVEAYSGELSNGAPLSGIISHYAVITGYERVDGQDLLLLNMGWAGSYDIRFLWNVAGKWLHLYTVDLNGAPDGDDFCAIDRGIDPTFLDSADLDLSFDWDIAPQTVLAGTSCGVLREVHVSEYYPTWSGPTFECDPFAGLDDVQTADPWDIGGTTTTNTHEPGGYQGGAPILDQIPPP